jgi:hypothetical protein
LVPLITGTDLESCSKYQGTLRYSLYTDTQILQKDEM